MEGKEILSVVDSVSSEKGLEKEIIFNAIELALASASQRHFHEDASLVVEIDKTSGNFVTGTMCHCSGWSAKPCKYHYQY